MLLTLSSCNDSPDIGNNYDDYSKSKKNIVYNNMFYRIVDDFGKNRIVYYNLDDAEQENDEVLKYHYLCPDNLCKHDNELCPSYLRVTDASIMIDKIESDKKNHVIMYIKDAYEITKYDTKNNKMELIVKYEGYNMPIDMIKYNDKLYIIVYSLDGYELRSMSLNGKNEVTHFIKSKEESFSFVGVYKEYVYFRDLIGTFFRWNIESETEEIVTLNAVELSEQISDGYLFFARDRDSVKYDEDSYFGTCSLYMIDLDYFDINDLEKNIELIENNILVNLVPCVATRNGKIFYNKCDNPTKLGENILKNPDGSTRTAPVWLLGTGKMYAYDIESKTNELLFNDNKLENNVFYYGDDNRVILKRQEYYKNEEGLWYVKNTDIIYNYKNNTIKEFESFTA